MNAPFYQYGAFGPGASLVVAIIIGLGFGFSLERAGFGNSRKLAAQFYFKDLAVFKVMFTAIVTAMIGLYLLSKIGVLDLSLIYHLPTYLVPQLLGGLLFGAGFVIGGYCPGTSCVAASSGKIDGLVLIPGMFFGIWVFIELYPRIEGFVNSTPMGELDIPQLTKLPYGAIVLAVLVLALVGFWLAQWIETRNGEIVQPVE
ncbi:MAG: DUF6691 family protein [Gemmatimonadota bacterium]